MLAHRTPFYNSPHTNCVGCTPQDGEGRPLACVCLFDPRGVGRSSVPQAKSHYSTDIMAADALGLLDHLGWRHSVRRGACGAGAEDASL